MTALPTLCRVLILLPPSEGKTAPARGRPLELRSLSFPSLTDTRSRVLDAVAEASHRADAPTVLGVSAGLIAEVARNTRLRTAPTAPAGAVYSGVLYDALGLDTLDAPARRRAARRVVVVSALFGALRLGDRIPAYRLSMSVNLPGVGPLATAWRGPLASALAPAAGGLVVDCRSSTYAAAWAPPPALAARWVHVAVPGATHAAKHTRGLVTRALCLHGGSPRTPAQLAAALKGSFHVELTAPARPGRPWILSATAH